jgi:hypothetical protein
MYTVRLDGFTSLDWADRLRDNGYRPAWQVDVGDDHATAETVNRPGKVPATFISDSLPSRQTRSPWRKWWMSLSCTTIRPDGLSSLLCVDEKSQMRALDRSQPVPPMTVGMPRAPHPRLRPPRHHEPAFAIADSMQLGRLPAARTAHRPHPGNPFDIGCSITES